ncbi:hypothetical protein SP15_125 [Bacillus phage SP-15]|uniref:SWIM-type domain-containing protein n=1 Tax=Bacillus phage SP-15 TaxID=1792032 RepID=A0A127AWG3_9CAUD|nr:hypothetical protein SP15_125 [Bacillus phage SP-15]AMM44923.1 hypothetical protein SP15_125 [Bacillus phage SP-15]
MGATSIPEHFNIQYDKTTESGTHLFKVRNEKSGGSYLVAVEVGTNHVEDCSCPHHIYRKQYCKHMKHVNTFLSENPRFLTQVTPSKVLPSVSAYDNKVIDKIVSIYKDRIKTDDKMHLYLTRCIRTWSKFQTPIYIEDVKYRFDDPFSSSEILAYQLGMED